MLIDSHCHLDDEQFEPDREAVIARARAAGVDMMLAVGAEPAVRLAERYPFMLAAVGIHPHEAATRPVEPVRDLLDHPRVVALGEIGLDYHYNFSPPEVQRGVFARQLALAAETGKPVVIHTREAWDDTMRLIRDSGVRRGVMHCFSEGPDEAAQCVALGFYISFAGIVTVPKAARIQAAATAVPLERLLVETDAPYLAPAPHRGKRNEPAFVVETARRLAALRQTTLEEIAAATTANFRTLFASGQMSPLD